MGGGRRRRPRRGGARAGRSAAHVPRLGRPGGAARRRVRVARRRCRREGRPAPLQLPRVPRGLRGRVQAARRSRQRQLPVPGDRARVPARQCRRRGRRHARARSHRCWPRRCRRSNGSRPSSSSATGATRPRCPARTTTTTCSRGMRPHPGRPVGRRPALLVHGRHDRAPQGRHVEPGDAARLRGHARATSARDSSRPARWRRPGPAAAALQARGTAQVQLPDHSPRPRHGDDQRVPGLLAGWSCGADGVAPLRRARAVARRRAGACHQHHHRRRPDRSAHGRGARRSRGAWPSVRRVVGAADPVVGRGVERAGEGGAARHVATWCCTTRSARARASGSRSPRRSRATTSRRRGSTSDPTPRWSATTAVSSRRDHPSPDCSRPPATSPPATTRTRSARRACSARSTAGAYAVPGDWARVDADGIGHVPRARIGLHHDRRREGLARGGRGDAEGARRRGGRARRRATRRRVGRGRGRGRRAGRGRGRRRRRHCATGRASGSPAYKVPRRVVVVDEVPRSPAGKADYRAARALAEA